MNHGMIFNLIVRVQTAQKLCKTDAVFDRVWDEKLQYLLRVSCADALIPLDNFFTLSREYEYKGHSRTAEMYHDTLAWFQKYPQYHEVETVFANAPEHQDDTIIIHRLALAA